MATLISATQSSLLTWKLLLLVSLAFAICNVKHHDIQVELGENVTATGIPAFVTALQSHTPSLRVFRGLFEFALVLVCTSVSLRVWENTFDRSTSYDVQRSYQDKTLNEKLGVNLIGDLLFRPINSEIDEGAEILYSPMPISHDEIQCENDIQLEMVALPTKNQNQHFQPPSSAIVANAAVDVLLLLLLFLLLFTLGSVSITMTNIASDATTLSKDQGFMVALAPGFPLVLFVILMLKVLIPWSKRSPFWRVVLMTVEAPRHPVTFRDGIVGDIITSVVRPLQDIAFTCFFVVSGLQGWWSSMYSLDEADQPIERSWLLHNVVLPACMISPLWMRFMQCLRQCYETRQRWPYLGNAMKYMIAAEVAMFGAFDPAKKTTFFWITSFFVATLYQIFWDVFFDWELFKVKINEGQEEGIINKGTQHCEKGKRSISVSLREKRLYPHRSMYYIIFVINFLLRFFWTLTLIPSNHLSRSGKLVEQVSTGIQHYVLPMIAVAEIIRRTLWGLLRVELQAIKVLEQHEKEQQTVVGSYEFKNLKHQDIEIHSDANDISMGDMQPMQICSEGETNGFPMHSVGFLKPLASGMFFNSMALATDFQVISELCIWSAVFMSLAIFAAAHRQ